MQIIAVEVDGKTIQWNGKAPLRLPAASSCDLVISYVPAPPTERSPGAVRILHQLEGLERDWLDVPCEMRLTAQFNKPPFRTQDVVGTYDFTVKGKSAGWHGTLANSVFTPRRERFVTPADATQALLIAYSGGGPEVVGVYFLADIRLYRLAADGSQTLEKDCSVLPAPDSTAARLNPINWAARDGDTRMAQAIRLRGLNAVGFVDGSPETHTLWRYFEGDDREIQVQPGVSYELEWQELYSVGSGGGAFIKYAQLSPGNYRFRVAAATAEGVPTGAEASVEIYLPPPVTQRTWFWTACATILTALVVGGWRYVAFIRLREQNALQEQRSRIARDIHDDLGSSLTRIAYLGDTLLAHPALASELADPIDRIRSTARELTRSMDEIVWAVDPTKDTIESLIGYLVGQAQELLSGAGVICRLDLPDTLPAESLSAEVRHNILLAFKEALNNVLRHSEATEVSIRFSIHANECELIIIDNGHGFDPAAATSRPGGGNGLNNMHKRLDVIGGRCEMESRPGSGTRLRFIWRLRP